ncbi:hypothetical protein BCR37DRAFT_385208 [Protomyces lactucae-debilis]|uniref:Uncharacterized protein n=1 Tax=Protomyces lactucae-debilis TaxID=2754530 RepID=A0A1Y2FVH2_PROLT|nr:uncharacterized protein BCR37DRAFT_385208 [Protomyces lactucae-debilis]ORY87959.1 hypothetical protein BCR37DRAFT_385208 [Protomyces lactucae-debilis]
MLRVQLSSFIFSILCRTTAQLGVLTCARSHGFPSQYLPRVQKLAHKVAIVVIVALSTLSITTYTSDHAYRTILDITVSVYQRLLYTRLACETVCGLLTCLFCVCQLVLPRRAQDADAQLFRQLCLLSLALLVALGCGIAGNVQVRAGVQHIFKMLQVNLTLIVSLLLPVAAERMSRLGRPRLAGTPSPQPWLSDPLSLIRQHTSYRGVQSSVRIPPAPSLGAFVSDSTDSSPRSRTNPVESSLGSSIHQREREADTIRNLSQLHQATRQSSIHPMRLRLDDTLTAEQSEFSVSNSRVNSSQPSRLSNGFGSRPRRHTVHAAGRRAPIYPMVDLRRSSYYSAATPSPINPGSISAGSSQEGSDPAASSAVTADSDISALIRQNFRLALTLHKSDKRASRSTLKDQTRSMHTASEVTADSPAVDGDEGREKAGQNLAPLVTPWQPLRPHSVDLPRRDENASSKSDARLSWAPDVEALLSDHQMADKRGRT